MNKKELKSEFQVGDIVISNFGRRGKIVEICTCCRCVQRGFFEPQIKWDNDHFDQLYDYISSDEAETGFKSYYQIGARIFPEHVYLDSIQEAIDETKDQISRAQAELDCYTQFLNKMKDN